MKATLESAAGFFEGEGCFTLTGKRLGHTPRARLGLNQKDREPLEMFQEAVGYSGSLRWAKNAIWMLEYWRRAEVLAITEMLVPLLSRRRQEQAARMLAASKPRRISRDHCLRGHLLIEPNIYFYGLGRHCKTCAIERQRARRLKVVV